MSLGHFGHAVSRGSFYIIRGLGWIWSFDFKIPPIRSLPEKLNLSQYDKQEIELGLTRKSGRRLEQLMSMRNGQLRYNGICMYTA